MSEELKPCPFCGGSDIGETYVETYSVDSSYNVFGCKDCGANFHEGSVEEWNTRAELSTLKAGQGEAQRLKDALSYVLKSGRGTSGRIILEPEEEEFLRGILTK